MASDTNPGFRAVLVLPPGTYTKRLDLRGLNAVVLCLEGYGG